MSPATPQEQILGIVNNHWQSCCVGAAAQLELADQLADGPLHFEILARRPGSSRGSSRSRCAPAAQASGTQTPHEEGGNIAEAGVAKICQFLNSGRNPKTPG